MDINALKEWIIPGSVLTTAISVLLALREYRLKAAAERRLAESAETESDVKLLRLFTELMDVAHARGGYGISDKAVEALLTPDAIKEAKDSKGLRALLDDTIISFPVGSASQDAAIAGICTLGKKHPVLKNSAIQALRSISAFKPEIADPYLNELENDAKPQR